MSEKVLLRKIHASKLAGYDDYVLIAVEADISEIPEEVVATLSWMKNAVRTFKQNSSIHLYCTLLAEAFENGGLDMQAVLAKAVPVKWTMDSVKEVIWKRIQVAMFPAKTSTTQLETTDVSEVYKTISRHMATEFEIDLEFPNRFNN